MNKLEKRRNNNKYKGNSYNKKLKIMIERNMKNLLLLQKKMSANSKVKYSSKILIELNQCQ